MTEKIIHYIHADKCITKDYKGGIERKRRNRNERIT